MNTDKAKLLEKNKELHEDIEKYREENNEIVNLLEIKEQEIEIINKNYKIIYTKMSEGSIKFLDRMYKRLERNIKKNGLEKLRK